MRHAGLDGVFDSAADSLDGIFDSARDALDAVLDTTRDSLREARYSARDGADPATSALACESVLGAARTTLERSFAETLRSLDVASQATVSALERARAAQGGCS